VNTAARLCAAAARDQILVSGAALRGLEAFFDTEPEFELALKGKREKVTVHRVKGRSDVRTRFEVRSQRGLTTLVRRRAELDRLTQLLDEAMRGRGQLAVVSGNPGIGKSRLLEEIGTRAAGLGVRTLRGSCEAYGEMAPLEPFLQALGQLSGIGPTRLEADAAGSDPLPAAEVLVRRVFTELVQDLSRRSPLLLLLANGSTQRTACYGTPS
jgi:hypothetical protein